MVAGAIAAHLAPYTKTSLYVQYIQNHIRIKGAESKLTILGIYIKYYFRKSDGLFLYIFS